MHTVAHIQLQNLSLSPCWRFHYHYDFIAITAPLATDSGMKCHLPCYLHADYNMCASSVSLHYVHIILPGTHSHMRVACSDTTALSRGPDGKREAVVINV